ncbi:MAG: hypothetical protein HQK99_11305 [Nitrospirae bacterium]|nr:hypothetical protein [Nitrospirota bacterium]
MKLFAMKKFVQTTIIAAILASTVLLLMPKDSEAVPSYSRRYGFDCTVCHSMWGALNGTGALFKLSGYRAFAGKDLDPVTKDIEAGSMFAIPTTLPLSLVTGVGYDYRVEKRSAADGTTNTQTGSSFALEDASIFLTSPIGPHLSVFAEFPMYETRAWEFTPTGPAEANDTARGSNLRFSTEKPTFEVAKFFWNNLLGDEVPRDSVNLLFGITHPPLPYSPGKVRLSVNQYPIYERRALDLLSHKKIDDMLTSDQSDTLFRVSEPQVLAEVYGMVVPGKEVSDAAKKETFWFEYHLGITNASNSSADNNNAKGFYGRYVMRWYGQTLGVFAFYTSDTYDDGIRNDASIFNGGIMSGKAASNSNGRIGPDLTLSAVPYGVPVWLENQYMYVYENNPTGFDKGFAWQGGFHQLNYQFIPKAVIYGRYDWVKGDLYDDTSTRINGVFGQTRTRPNEYDIVAGLQFTIAANVKLLGEYRYHEFKDTASVPNSSRLTDSGFTSRIMFGF